MTAFRADMTVDKDGSLMLRQLPFAQGERVEVIVLPRPSAPSTSGLSETLMRGPQIGEEELKAVEEIHQWLTAWPTES